MSIQRQALIHAARLGYQQLSNIVMRERMGHAVGLVPGVLGDVDAAKIADQVEAMTKQREAPPGQAREALEAARGWIVGVAHRVGGHEVVEKIDEALAALSAPTEQVPAGDVLRVLANVIGEYDRNLCTHEETHRGGAIWTICDGCGRKWADDRGGFEPYKDPASVEEARAMLAASPSAPTAVQPADDALTPTERAACQQCGSDPHKMSCTVGGKDQLRLTAVATPTAVKEAGGVDALPAPDLEALRKFARRYASLMEQWREAPGGSQEIANLHASFKGMERQLGQFAESGALQRIADAPAAQPATPVAPKTLEALTDGTIAVPLDTLRQLVEEARSYDASLRNAEAVKWAEAALAAGERE